MCVQSAGCGTEPPPPGLSCCWQQAPTRKLLAVRRLQLLAARRPQLLAASPGVSSCCGSRPLLSASTAGCEEASAASCKEAMPGPARDPGQHHSRVQQQQQCLHVRTKPQAHTRTQTARPHNRQGNSDQDSAAGSRGQLFEYFGLQPSPVQSSCPACPNPSNRMHTCPAYTTPHPPPPGPQLTFSASLTAHSHTPPNTTQTS